MPADHQTTGPGFVTTQGTQAAVSCHRIHGRHAAKSGIKSVIMCAQWIAASGHQLLSAFAQLLLCHPLQQVSTTIEFICSTYTTIIVLHLSTRQAFARQQCSLLTVNGLLK